MAVTEVFTRLDELLDGLPLTGVVHVGAHKGQEVPYYRAAGFDRIVLVEPNPARWPSLTHLGSDVTVHPCAAGPSGRATLHITPYDEQSSLLRPLRKEVVRRVEVDVRPLADLQDDCNVAVLDIQGGELDALATADLDRLDLVVVECCTKARYQGAATTDAVDAHMTAAGWQLAGRFAHRHPDLSDVAWRRP